MAGPARPYAALYFPPETQTLIAIFKKVFASLIFNTSIWLPIIWNLRAGCNFGKKWLKTMPTLPFISPGLSLNSSFLLIIHLCRIYLVANEKQEPGRWATAPPEFQHTPKSLPSPRTNEFVMKMKLRAAMGRITIG